MPAGVGDNEAAGIRYGHHKASSSTGAKFDRYSCVVGVCRVQLDSELVQWRTLFIFTASIHLLSAVIFVLLADSHQPNSSLHPQPQGPVDSQAPPTDCEAPPSAEQPVVGAPPGDEDSRSAVDSDAEYGSVTESIEEPTSNSVQLTDRDLHLAQLMESIL